MSQPFPPHFYETLSKVRIERILILFNRRSSYTVYIPIIGKNKSTFLYLNELFYYFPVLYTRSSTHLYILLFYAVYYHQILSSIWNQFPILYTLSSTFFCLNVLFCYVDDNIKYSAQFNVYYHQHHRHCTPDISIGAPNLNVFFQCYTYC